MAGPARHQLAQINVARMLYPLTDPGMSGFVAQLARINALADRAPGFVWRLQDDSGNATGLSPFDDPMVIVNMSVWRSPEALFDFVYRSAHNEVMRQRKAWRDRRGPTWRCGGCSPAKSLASPRARSGSSIFRSTAPAGTRSPSSSAFHHRRSRAEP